MTSVDLAAQRATNGGRTQIINGQQYSMYSPQWYEAMDADKIRRAGVAGTAAGTAGKAALTALGDVAGSTSTTMAAGSGGSNGLPPRIGGGSGAPGYETFNGGGADAPIPQISKPDQSAAESAVFGKAKDQVGQESAGALAGLRSALAATGRLGGQGEYRGVSGIVQKGQQQLGDVTRQQAVTHLSNEMDIDKANQAAALTGRGQDITKRGQNMDYTLGGRGQDIQQRGQDIQYEESQAQLNLTKSLQEAARRQSILQGIMGAINGPTLY